ncbi:uL13 family ribosomal protein, partial [Helicobacter pylori]
QEMLEKTPEKLYHLAVRGMLPKTKLGKAMIKKLKVYRDDKHPHTAQTSKKDAK